MFDLIGKNRRLVQIVLFIIAVPFAFFGVDSYLRTSGGGQSVARVGDYNISQQEFTDVLRERQDALRRLTEGKVDSRMLNSPELRYATLDDLIQRRLLLDRAIRAGMTVSDEQIKQFVEEQPAFRDESNRFSYERYQQRLRADGMTPSLYENRLRQELMLGHQRQGVFGSGFVSKIVLDRLTQAAEQQREVSFYRISPERYKNEVHVSPEAVKQYYEANQREFQIPERVKVDYVVLSVDALMPQIQLDPEEVKRYFESRRAQYQVPEARQASHILISSEASAGADAREKARARAEEIHKQLVAKPESFAELAKQHSQDPGSATNGGDLGFISRGTMRDVPEFEAALFKLKEGEVSPPVESKHGFHIIRLTKVQPAQGKSFEQVRGEIEGDLRKRRAERRFAELAERFNNATYEQSESLKPAAEIGKSEVRRSGWITRDSADPAILNNPQFREAVFSYDVLKDRRNSDAIEVAPNTLVSARLVEHQAASTRSLADVRADIEKTLLQQAAAKRAVETGRDELEQLKQGKSVTAEWSAPKLINRAESGELSEAAVRQAFRVDTAKLPVYTGSVNPAGGFTLLRVSRVVSAETIAPDKRKQFAEGLRRVVGEQEYAAYLGSVRQKTEITVNKDRLEQP